MSAKIIILEWLLKVLVTSRLFTTKERAIARRRGSASSVSSGVESGVSSRRTLLMSAPLWIYECLLLVLLSFFWSLIEREEKRVQGEKCKEAGNPAYAEK